MGKYVSSQNVDLYWKIFIYKILSSKILILWLMLLPCYRLTLLPFVEAGAPKFYGLPKIHKQDTPLRPIVSSTGTVSYNTSKELARILKPLVGKSQHHLQNTMDFIQQLKDVKLQKDETIISYDIKALFTSVSIQPVLNIIKNRLENYQQLQKRTSMSVSQITSLLEYCLRSTYFVFQGKYYEQLEGALWVHH